MFISRWEDEREQKRSEGTVYWSLRRNKMMTKASRPQTTVRETRWPCINNTLTAAVWSALILRGLISVCLLSDIRTSEEEDVGDDIIHRRQECSEYYRRGHERDKQPRRRQQRSWCGLNRSQNLQRPSWIRINTLCVSLKTTNTYGQ